MTPSISCIRYITMKASVLAIETESLEGKKMSCTINAASCLVTRLRASLVSGNMWQPFNRQILRYSVIIKLS